MAAPSIIVQQEDDSVVSYTPANDKVVDIEAMLCSEEVFVENMVPDFLSFFIVENSTPTEMPLIRVCSNASLQEIAAAGNNVTMLSSSPIRRNMSSDDAVLFSSLSSMEWGKYTPSQIVVMLSRPDLYPNFPSAEEAHAILLAREGMDIDIEEVVGTDGIGFVAQKLLEIQQYRDEEISRPFYVKLQSGDPENPVILQVAATVNQTPDLTPNPTDHVPIANYIRHQINSDEDAVSTGFTAIETVPVELRGLYLQQLFISSYLWTTLLRDRPIRLAELLGNPFMSFQSLSPLTFQHELNATSEGKYSIIAVFQSSKEVIDNFHFNERGPEDSPHSTVYFVGVIPRNTLLETVESGDQSFRERVAQMCWEDLGCPIHDITFVPYADEDDPGFFTIVSTDDVVSEEPTNFQASSAFGNFIEFGLVPIYDSTFYILSMTFGCPLGIGGVMIPWDDLKIYVQDYYRISATQKQRHVAFDAVTNDKMLPNMTISRLLGVVDTEEPMEVDPTYYETTDLPADFDDTV